MTQDGVCISGLTSGYVLNVLDFDTCKLECEKAGADVCVSAELNTASNKCWFNSADTSTTPVAPCANYVYSEPSGKLTLFILIVPKQKSEPYIIILQKGFIRKRLSKLANFTSPFKV